MHPPHEPQDQDQTRRRRRAAARADLLLAQVHEFLGDLDRGQAPIPAPLKDAAGALAQVARELHEQAGEVPGCADALLAMVRGQERRGAVRLADRAEVEAAHLLALATSAAVHGRCLPWGVEPAARGLTDWARRLRGRA